MNRFEKALEAMPDWKTDDNQVIINWLADHGDTVRESLAACGKDGLEGMLNNLPENWEWTLSCGPKGECETTHGFWMVDPNDDHARPIFGNSNSASAAVRAAMEKIEGEKI